MTVYMWAYILSFSEGCPYVLYSLSRFSTHGGREFLFSIISVMQPHFIVRFQLRELLDGRSTCRYCVTNMKGARGKANENK